MRIIPHNPIKVQVGIAKKTDEKQTVLRNNPILTSGLTKTQYEARVLYDAGFNVLPQPYGRKGGYPWKRLQYARLNRNDESYGLQTLFAGQVNMAVMCGATSGNLFVIDCETENTLLYHMREMRKRELPLWVVRTARGGHIYLRAQNGEVHSVEPGVLPDAEIRGGRGYVLAPPSTHPSGAIYTWLLREGTAPPKVNSEQINWLHDQSGQPVKLTVERNNSGQRGNWKMRVVSPASNLSNQTRDYLENGHTLPQGTRNNRLFNAACDLNGNGYSQSEADGILTPVAAMSGLPAGEIRATIASAYSRQREAARPDTTPIYGRMTWRYALLWGTQQSWQGRTGSSDRALFLALVERSRVSPTDGLFRASIRELSELARLGTTTVQRGLKRLYNAGIIITRGSDHLSKATLWTFSKEIIHQAKEIELNMNTVKIPPHWLRYSESVFNSVVCERPALGHGVSFIYQFMQTLEAPMMPLEMAESLGVTVNQINYALRKLQDLDLVRRFEAGWYPLEMTLPELESFFEGAGEAGARRAARYRREREVFVGRILFRARLRREGAAFQQAVTRTVSDLRTRERVRQQILDDPLLQLGLELGGEIVIGENMTFSRCDLVQ